MSARVEPEWEMVTVAFVDIRGFTSFSDRSTAREAVDFLNDFFELVIPVVTDHDGHVNKLTGDGLLAVFGAPLRSPDHADLAVSAGREILAAVASQFGDRCRIGIGINSGLVLIGTVGGGGYAELAVIGDPVNVAARIQDATRELGEELLLTEATRCLLADPGAGLTERARITLRGKPKPVAVYALSSRNGSRTPAA